MLRIPVLTACLAAVALVAVPGAWAADFGGTPEAQRAAGEELGRLAHTYGFPLLEFERTRATDLKRSAPLNVLANTRKLADADDRSVVAPNVDTLYSVAQLDLGKEPVVLRLPRHGSRYYVFEFLDPYTNVVGYIGRRLNGGGAGTWAISWTGGKRVALPKGVRRFNSPYRRLWVIGRTLLRGERDLPAARRLMARYRSGPLSRLRSGRLSKPVVRRSIRDTSTLPRGLALLDELGRAIRRNPPPKRDAPVLARLRQGGIGPGLAPSRAGLPRPVLDGLAAGVDAEAAELGPRARAKVFTQALSTGGWYSADPDIGDYGTDYTLRAEIAEVGLGANTVEEAVYPIAFADRTGAPFTGARGYRLTFRRGALPPARAFWSLTMYDLEGYLVGNAANVYAVGDSHPPLRRRSDGSIVVAIQRERPAERDVNWLPAPAGAFRLNLRLYEPTKAVLGGRWRPPGVEPVG